jgi:hypothetical protein
MDISGRIEALLKAMAEQRPRFGTDPRDPRTILMDSAMGTKDEQGFYLNEKRSVYRYLGHTAMLTQVPMDDAGGFRDSHNRSIVAGMAQDAEKLLRQPRPPSIDLLWHHWVLTAAWRRKVWSADQALLGALWKKAFSSQNAAGHLHPLSPDTAMDSFVYDELCAIHAAYRSTLAMADPDMLQRVRRMVQWHVASTQPDHTTAEPWGLAAFAALDETGTFAEQQLHDAVAGAKGGLILMGLLADALLAMRDAEGTSV